MREVLNEVERGEDNRKATQSKAKVVMLTALIVLIVK